MMRMKTLLHLTFHLVCGCLVQQSTHGFVPQSKTGRRTFLEFSPHPQTSKERSRESLQILSFMDMPSNSDIIDESLLETRRALRSKEEKENPPTSSIAADRDEGGFIRMTIDYQDLFNQLDAKYTVASTAIKCPFFKKRAADLIDSTVVLLKFFIVTLHQYTPFKSNVPFHLLQIPGCKPMAGTPLNPDGTGCKIKNMSISEILRIIESDWNVHNDKGYYITGKLSSKIYRDDCHFDGPDPDMPVTGLRKYLGAASQIFDRKKSFAKLIKLKIDEEAEEQIENTSREGGGKFGHGTIVAYWHLRGELRIPGKPKIKPFTGWTKYHLDEDGLIAYHEEGWDISPLEAFAEAFLPH